MKNKKFFHLLCTVALFSCLIFAPSIRASAEVENGNGGQVSTNGKITFYEGSKDSLETPVVSSESEKAAPPGDNSAKQSNTPSGKQPGKQPGKNLMLTGELLQQFSWIGAGLLLFVVFVVYKRRRGEKSS